MTTKAGWSESTSTVHRPGWTSSTWRWSPCRHRASLASAACPKRLDTWPDAGAGPRRDAALAAVRVSRWCTVSRQSQAEPPTRPAHPLGGTMRTDVLLLSHGSRAPEARDYFLELAQMVKALTGWPQ